MKQDNESSSDSDGPLLRLFNDSESDDGIPLLDTVTTGVNAVRRAEAIAAVRRMTQAIDIMNQNPVDGEQQRIVGLMDVLSEFTYLRTRVNVSCVDSGRDLLSEMSGLSRICANESVERAERAILHCARYQSVDADDLMKALRNLERANRDV